MGLKNSMTDLLDKMDQVDQSVLWVDLNNKVNKLSTAVMLVLDKIEQYEEDSIKLGSIPTIVEIKKILEDVIE